MQDLHVYALKLGNQRDKRHLYGCKLMGQTSHLYANAGGGRESACAFRMCVLTAAGISHVFAAWKQPSVADGDKFAPSVITQRELREQKEVTWTF